MHETAPTFEVVLDKRAPKGDVLPSLAQLLLASLGVAWVSVARQ
jgi:hypothetical protein